MYTKLNNLTVPASRLGKLQRKIYGMPSDNLLRYYSFDDGSVGDPVTTFPDLSGNAAAASLFSGSSGVTRTTGGVVNDDAQGFAFDSGVSMTGQVTLVLVNKSLVVPDDSLTAAYIMFAGPADNVVSSLTSSQSILAPGPWLMTAPYPTDGVGNVWAYSGGGDTWESTGDTFNRVVVTNDEQAPNDYRVSVLSWDTDSGVMRLVSTNGSATRDTVETSNLSELAALDSNLMLGVFQRATNGVSGELGLGAIYSGLMTIEQMQDHASFARDIVAARGVTVL